MKLGHGWVMMTSSNGSNFRVTDHLCGEFTGPRWIPRTKASGAELWCFLIRVWINGWVNSDGAGDLRHYRAHYDFIVMVIRFHIIWLFIHVLISLINPNKRAPGKKRSKIVTIFAVTTPDSKVHGDYMGPTWNLPYSLWYFLWKISAIKCFIWNK